MATKTTRINGSSSQAGYGYYANVIVDDTIQSNNTFKVVVNTYIVNNGSIFNSSNWHKHSRIDQANEPYQRDLYSQSINTTGVSRYGGETLLQSETFYVPITKKSMYVVSYLSKSSYASYEPGYCELSGDVAVPKVSSIWSTSLLNIPNIENSFTLPITKYVSEYYNVVEVRNSNNTLLIRTINDVNNGDSITFTSSELETIYTMDSNANKLPLVFYMDLKTYTNSSKTTQVGSTQRLKCEAYLVNSEPTYTKVEEELNSNVIALLGSSTGATLIENASILKVSIGATAKNGATISKVYVGQNLATYDSVNQVYTYTIDPVLYDSFAFAIQDSRGLETSNTSTHLFWNYIACKINSWSIERASQTSSDLILNANVSVFNGSISGTQNTIVVKYSIDNTNWTTIPSSSYTITDNVLTITNLTLNNVLSYQQPGTFYLDVSDILTEHKDNKPIKVGIYTMAKSDRKVRINGTLELADENGQNRINVKDIVKWTLLGSKTGDTPIDLPSSFNEIYCDIIIGGLYNAHIPIIIPYQALSSDINGFNNGYYAGTNTNAQGRIQATTTSAKCSEASLNNTNYLSTTTINYYYR